MRNLISRAARQLTQKPLGFQHCGWQGAFGGAFSGSSGLDSQQVLPISQAELCPKLFMSISIVVVLVLFPALFPTLFPDLMHNLLPNLAANLSSIYGNMAPPFVTSLFPQLA
ncbi:hypothetical protein KFL_001660110 [Klebsormidium nitens]|uniref:Uncharacterized protein n=1 Tax=Klebsormidium nitens TaxID=105231 RepID=A0A1Y1HYZ3_KLENI|nr:hypothetical protein KFL_001660110 [Klebsormidium nitens]|eukprot:GAQ83874.1 hypothetical protein KFL_001660110 [Klebsormidium nitens]